MLLSEFRPVACRSLLSQLLHVAVSELCRLSEFTLTGQESCKSAVGVDPNVGFTVLHKYCTQYSSHENTGNLVDYFTHTV